MVTEKEILKALSVIIDPDFKQDIVSLGFVQNIKISDDLVGFDIELTTPACPIKAEFQRAAEEAVMALEGVAQVAVNMTSREQRKLNNGQGLDKVKNIIAVASGKGGVGKSTVSAHLANELAERGYKVGLLDTDLFGPSVPSLFNVHDADIRQTSEGMIVPYECENGLKLLSFGFLMGSGPAIMRGPMVSGYMQQVLTNTAWEELDYLVLDLPPGTGDIQLTITQTLQISGAVVVTTRQSLSIADVTKGIEMFEKVNVPMLGIVENMSYFICDDCDKKHYIFGDSNKTSLEETYGLKTLAELPLNPKLTGKVADAAGDPDMNHMVDQVIRSLGMQTNEKLERPTVNITEATINLNWESGKSYEIPFRKLRLACPCASCVDEYTGEQLLKPEHVPMDIKAEEVTPLGNYAVVVKWSDGHSSGIYSYANIDKIMSWDAEITPL
jgi:ATP-binding protein involved in chromosome partitioning